MHELIEQRHGKRHIAMTPDHGIGDILRKQDLSDIQKHQMNYRLGSRVRFCVSRFAMAIVVGIAAQVPLDARAAAFMPTMPISPIPLMPRSDARSVLLFRIRLTNKNMTPRNFLFDVTTSAPRSSMEKE